MPSNSPEYNHNYYITKIKLNPIKHDKHKELSRQYYKDHKSERKKYSKLYYKNNKLKYNIRNKELTEVKNIVKDNYPEEYNRIIKRVNKLKNLNSSQRYYKLRILCKKFYNNNILQCGKYNYFCNIY